MEKTRNWLVENKFYVIVTVIFLFWAAFFIWNYSDIAWDGNRYFSLFDDALISMRYAWNFSHGHGLVWNPGERVEGYTNLFMVLIMAVSTAIFDKRLAVIPIQILGIGTVISIGYVAVKIAQEVMGEVTRRNEIKVFVFLLVVSYFPLSYWSILGMETGIQTLLLLLSIYCTFLFIRTNREKYFVLLSILLGLAYLTRPDSMIIAILVFGYLFYEAYISKTVHMAFWKFILFGLLFSVFPIGQQIFRMSYYGEVFPNTYLLKVGGIPLLTRIRNGLYFLFDFFKSIIVVFLLTTVGMSLHQNKRKLFLLLIFLAQIAYQIYVGGDAWPTFWRMFIVGIILF